MNHQHWLTLCRVLFTAIITFLLFVDESSINYIFQDRGNQGRSNEVYTEETLSEELFWENITSCEWRNRPWKGDDNNSISGSYPLTQSKLMRSFIPGSIESWNRVVKALNFGKEINIVVLGGSMTTGSECGPRDVDGTHLLCAWSTFVSSWISRQYPLWKVKLNNIARGGMSAGSWNTWPQIGPGSSDVYIIDTTVNAQVYCNARQSDDILSQITIDMANLITRLLSTRGEATDSSPAILMVQTFRTCSTEINDCKGHCKNSELKSLERESYSWCECWWRMGDYEAQAARSLDIPVASYRDAIWPNINSPPIDLPFFWNGLSHPDRVAHELVSDVVKYALQQLFLSSSRVESGNPSVDLLPQQSSETSTQSAGCSSRSFLDSPYFSVGVHDIKTFKSASLRAGSAWSFYEDRPLKPGWIGNWISRLGDEDGASLTVSFNVIFSDNPRLELTYVRSYEGFTDVQVYLEGCIERIDSKDGMLSGQWVERYSLPFSTIWVSDSAMLSNDSHSQAFRLFDGQCSLKGIPKEMRITLLNPGKFKLLSITSC